MVPSARGTRLRALASFEVGGSKSGKGPAAVDEERGFGLRFGEVGTSYGPKIRVFPVLRLGSLVARTV